MQFCFEKIATVTEALNMRFIKNSFRKNMLRSVLGRDT